MSELWCLLCRKHSVIVKWINSFKKYFRNHQIWTVHLSSRPTFVVDIFFYSSNTYLLSTYYEVGTELSTVVLMTSKHTHDPCFMEPSICEILEFPQFPIGNTSASWVWGFITMSSRPRWVEASIQCITVSEGKNAVAPNHLNLGREPPGKVKTVLWSASLGYWQPWLNTESLI